jgi:hypothetical protein
VWDVSLPATVVLDDGSSVRPVHRIQPVRVIRTSGGHTSTGHGSLTFVAETDVDRDERVRVTAAT